VLEIIFALFCIVVSIQMLMDFKVHAAVKKPSNLQIHSAGVIIGSLSTILGIGGGSLTASFLNYYNVPIRTIVGTCAAVGLPIALAGTLGIIIASIGKIGLPAWSTGYIYWPAFLGIVLTSIIVAPLGAHLAHKLPVGVLKKIFALMLLFIGLKFLW
ncbi:MAG: sulfite exporter TauE/SafE family protein, partial [Gammaproteobacteria bacterium]